MSRINEELTEFAEEKLREIYEIPHQEHVCVQLHNNYLDVYIPYVTSDIIHISVDGLLKQLKGITNIPSYLRTKTRFIKNILKNSITCKNVDSPFFISELKFFERNRRSLYRELNPKQSKVNNMYRYVNKVSSDYMLNCSNLELTRDLNKMNLMFSELGTGDLTREALRGEYKKEMVCSLERGLFTVSLYGFPVFQHDITDFSFDNIFAIKESTNLQYREFKNYFDNKLPKETKKKLQGLSHYGTKLIKYQNHFELSEDIDSSPIHYFLCTSNSTYTEYYAEMIPLTDLDKIDELKDKTMEKIEVATSEYNKVICKSLRTFRNILNYCIINSLKDKKNKSIEECIESVVVMMEEQKYQDEYSIFFPVGEVERDDISASIRTLIEKGYVKEKDNGLCIEERVPRNVKKMLSYYDRAVSVINQDPDTEDEVPEKPNIGMMSVFDLMAYMEYLSETDQEECDVEELLDLVENPLFAESLKEYFIDYFSKINEGKYLPLVKLKYMLNNDMA